MIRIGFRPGNSELLREQIRRREIRPLQIKRRKKQLVLCTVLLLFSSAQLTPLVNYLLLALIWPYFAWIEQDGSEQLRRPFGAILAIEVVCLALRLAVGMAGVTALWQVSNVAWLLALAARGWLLLECYRREERML